MKPADNFNPAKWLVENKLTTQSRLNENEAYLSPDMQKQFNMIVSALKRAKSDEDIDRVHSDIILLPKKLTKIFIDKLVNMGLADRVGEGKYSLSYDDGLDENKITTQYKLNESKLNENKIPGVNIEVLEDYVELSGDSGDYAGFIEDNGTISFSIIYEDEDDRDGMEFDDENWKDILGDDHVFVKIANAIPTKVEAIDDYVMITVKADDLISISNK